MVVVMAVAVGGGGTVAVAVGVVVVVAVGLVGLAGIVVVVVVVVDERRTQRVVHTSNCFSTTQQKKYPVAAPMRVGCQAQQDDLGVVSLRDTRRYHTFFSS